MIFPALPWRLIGIAAIGFLILALGVALKMERTQNAKLKAQITACVEARKADRATYEKAQAQAALQNKQQVDRIKGDQERVNDETKAKYERDLARLRAGGLRPEYAAPASPSQGSGTGPVPDATGGADAETVPVPRTVILQAAEGELRCNALIDWINSQVAVSRD